MVELVGALLVYVPALEKHQAHRGTLAGQLGVFETLVLCDRLEQLTLRYENGELVLMVGWLRGDYADLDALFELDLSRLEAFGRERLTTGPVLYVAEVLATKPGLAYSEMRRLQRLPGVTHMAAWRNLTRRKVQKVVRDGWNGADEPTARANRPDAGATEPGEFRPRRSHQCLAR